MRQLASVMRRKYGLIVVLLIGNIVLGLLITGDYGEPIDEYGDFKYGEDTLQAYIAPEQMSSHGDREYYGPFYLMAASVSSDALTRIRTGWMVSEGRHFSNFLAFQLGVFFFYVLATRFAGRWAALAGTLLFCYQPLLFGHSFINQKDIPFMAFFTASIALGLIAVDALATDGPPPADSADKHRSRLVRVRHVIADDWSRSTGRIKLGLIASLSLAVLLAVELFGGRILLPWLQELVRGAYFGTGWRPIVSLFRAVATDASKTPLTLYLDKVGRAYLWLRLPVALLGFVPFVFTVRAIFKGTIGAFQPGWFNRSALLILAGIILGLCTSIRVAGPFAGALVSLAMLVRIRGKSVVPLLGYWSVALLTTYVTWPFLWGDPFRRLWQVVRLMGDFPGHSVLYDGQLLSSRSLPWHYMPRLLAIQLTEPAVLLAVVGLAFGVWIWLKRPEHRLDRSIVGLWFGIPAGAEILLRTPLYGNIRQVLFVLPAIFLFCTMGIAEILKLLRAPGLQAVLAMMFLLPGVLAINRLHPYEYTYYNAFIGGVDGAFGLYEIDPWCISYREAIEYINRVAPRNATVAVTGLETGGVASFARGDLVIKGSTSGRPDTDFAIACKRTVGAQGLYPDMATVYQVRRGAAILAEVEQAY